MPEFFVRTLEQVEGTYQVEAESEKAARAKFDQPGLDWTGVEQVDFMTFHVEVQEVRLDPSSQSTVPLTDDEKNVH
jgi:hypothetical protein